MTPDERAHRDFPQAGKADVRIGKVEHALVTGLSLDVGQIFGLPLAAMPQTGAPAGSLTYPSHRSGPRQAFPRTS
jgi:hypothetical protein